MKLFPIGLETPLTSATTVNDAPYVSVLNTSGSAVQIEIRNANPNPFNVATITINAGERLVLGKEKGWKMIATSDVLAVPVQLIG